MKIKNEAELLNKFCDVFHVKPLLRTPFLNTEYNEEWLTLPFLSQSGEVKALKR